MLSARRLFRSVLQVRMCSTIPDTLKKYVFVQAMDQSSVDKAAMVADDLGLTRLELGASRLSLASYNVLQVTKDRIQLCYFVSSTIWCVVKAQQRINLIAGKNKFGIVKAVPMESFYTDFTRFYRNLQSPKRRTPLIRSMVESKDNADQNAKEESDEVESNKTHLPLLGKSIVDCTAGIGQDSFMLARAGASVSLIERNPIVYTLLKDGFERVKHTENTAVQEVASRMKLEEREDSIRVLERLVNSQGEKRPDIVYIDPLPHTKKQKLNVTKQSAYKDLPRFFLTSQLK